MTITEVKITPIVPKAGLIAFASIVLDNAIKLNSIGIYTRKDGTGYRITYPTKAARNHDCYVFQPITEEMGTEIALAVLRKADTVLTAQVVKDYAGYNNPEHF